jgi:hypothetical protein
LTTGHIGSESKAAEDTAADKRRDRHPSSSSGAASRSSFSNGRRRENLTEIHGINPAHSVGSGGNGGTFG